MHRSNELNDKFRPLELLGIHCSVDPKVKSTNYGFCEQFIHSYIEIGIKC